MGSIPTLVPALGGFHLRPDDSEETHTAGVQTDKTVPPVPWKETLWTILPWVKQFTLVADWVWWHMPVIPATWRLRQEGLKFEASLGN